jgi:hypothetical protein
VLWTSARSVPPAQPERDLIAEKACRSLQSPEGCGLPLRSSKPRPKRKRWSVQIRLEAKYEPGTPHALELARSRQWVRTRENADAAQGCVRELPWSRQTYRPAAIVTQEYPARRYAREVRVDDTATFSPPLAKSPGQHRERTLSARGIHGRGKRFAVRNLCAGAEGQHFETFGADDLATSNHQQRQRAGPCRQEGDRFLCRRDLPFAGSESATRQRREKIHTRALGEHEEAAGVAADVQLISGLFEIGRGRIEEALALEALVNVDVAVDQGGGLTDLAGGIETTHLRLCRLRLVAGGPALDPGATLVPIQPSPT